MFEDCGLKFEVVEYLKNLFMVDELRWIFGFFGKVLRDIFRCKEVKDVGFDDWDLSDEELVEFMVVNLVVIERFIVVKGEKAVFGRFLENVLGIL